MTSSEPFQLKTLNTSLASNYMSNSKYSNSKSHGIRVDTSMTTTVKPSSLLTPVLSAQRTTTKKKSTNGTHTRRSHVSSHGMSTGVATPLTKGKMRASRGRRDFVAVEKRKGALEDKFNKLFNAITQEKDQLRASSGVSPMTREIPRSTSQESLCASALRSHSKSRSQNPHLKS